jgi:diguanylate cyclase (GGDEF)-like protein/PAS domain S-box-containing protein
MTEKQSYINKSRYVVAAAVLLFFLGISSIVLMFTRHTDTLIDTAVVEAEQDLLFLSDILKKAYLNKDFVGIEHTLSEWVQNNRLVFSLHAISANGYRLFTYISDKSTLHKRKLQQEITHDGRLLLTLNVERDLSDVVTESEKLRNKFIVTGLGFGLLLGIVTWFLLHKFAFTPLAQEINRRQFAESALKITNEELETRVQERTGAIKKLSRVVEQTDDIVVVTDPHGIIEYINPAFTKNTGYSVAEVVGNNINITKSGLHDNSFYRELWETILAGKSFQEIFINRKKNGDIYYEEKTITPLRDENGLILNFVATGKDISDRMEIQEKLHHMATHDLLTNLPNKLTIVDRLTHAIEQSKRNKLNIAVMFLDLDQFKHVNDSLGHHTGDALLKIVALKLQKSIRSSDSVGRFGGDEFTIIMEGIRDTSEVSVIAQKILDAVSEPVVIGGYEIITSTSIGVTIYPDDSDNVDSLLKNADVAMYRAKSKGGHALQFYTRDMSIASLERMELQHRLNHARERNEFRLYYQPRIDVKSGRISGMEALIRWHNPDIGHVEPDKFIPILEETGKIIEVGSWVIRTACEFNAGLIKKGIKPLRVSVNLSARQFRDDSLQQYLEETLKQCKLDPCHLEIEITESLLFDNIDKAILTLEKLHQLGVHISIDDFGTGYSSMSYLKKFPIDSIKIDRSFIHGLPDDKDDEAIVNAILAMGKNLGLQLIAEGVETEAQTIFLQKCACDELQGYYLSTPLPADEFIEFLHIHNDKSALG